MTSTSTLPPSYDKNQIPASVHGKHPMCDVAIESSNLKCEWILSNPDIKSPHSYSIFLTTNDILGGSSLHIAAVINNYFATKILLSHGAEVDFLGVKGLAALHVAASEGYSETMLILIKHGANPIARDKYGYTPAMLAADGHLSSLKLLANLKISLSHRDHNGRNILTHAAMDSPQTLSYLLTKGLSVYTPSRNGTSLVFEGLANSEKTPAFQALLFNWDIDFHRVPGLISKWNWTVETRISTFRFLLKRLPKEYVARELDLNTCKLTIGSPLRQAAMGDHVAIMEMFIQAGANIEVDIQGQGTPLIAACSAGRLSAVKCLLRAGAKIIGTKAGVSCSALEAASDSPAMIQWLLVQRHTEQGKIATFCHEDSEQEIQNWSGPRYAEVVITGLYAPVPSDDSLSRLIELVGIRKDFQGKVVIVDSFRN
ncbi:hypothetical protein EG329_008339 [Mollisiaceae sp. DMI_Dod_QoI]|nr:hypothetical protein EG329_008339 [Helotiales sp. DMI_Dod_QoI]